MELQLREMDSADRLATLLPATRQETPPERFRIPIGGSFERVDDASKEVPCSFLCVLAVGEVSVSRVSSVGSGSACGFESMEGLTLSYFPESVTVLLAAAGAKAEAGQLQ